MVISLFWLVRLLICQIWIHLRSIMKHLRAWWHTSIVKAESLILNLKNLWVYLAEHGYLLNMLACKSWFRIWPCGYHLAFYPLDIGVLYMGEIQWGVLHVIGVWADGQWGVRIERLVQLARYIITISIILFRILIIWLKFISLLY